MPDKYAMHGYESERDGHRNEAKRALTFLKQHVDRALVAIDGPDPTGLTYECRQAAAYSAEAWARVQALKALYDVRFLVEDGAE